MRIEIDQEQSVGRLTVKLAEECHGDSLPPVTNIHFHNVRQWATPDTTALAGAILAARWSGETLTFGGLKVGTDAAEAILRIVEDARFVQPVDGYRRNLCEGHLDLLVAPAAEACDVLGAARTHRRLTRLVTWSGEFVDPSARSSLDYLAGEVSTNADLLLPAWEVSACLGLLIGGSQLGAIVVPEPDREHLGDFERLAEALRLIGVQLRTATGVPFRMPEPKRVRREWHESPAAAELIEKAGGRKPAR